MTPQFDPKLKELISKIDALVKEYDVMATVNVISRTHGEFGIFFPTWSVAQWENLPNGQKGMRFRSKNAKQGTQKFKDTEDTVHGIMSIRDMSAHFFQWMETVKTELDKHMEIDHTPGPIIPHGEN